MSKQFAHIILTYHYATYNFRKNCFANFLETSFRLAWNF